MMCVFIFLPTLYDWGNKQEKENLADYGSENDLYPRHYHQTEANP